MGVWVQLHHPHLWVLSALALGNRHGLWMGSEVQGWEVLGWGTEGMCVGILLVLG